jgi:Transglutaminase-like superfamily
VRTATDLELAAHDAGLSVDQVERVPMPGTENGWVLASRMSFEDPWAAARLLQTLSDEDASDPFVRAWSLEILQATAAELGLEESGPTLSSELLDAYAQSLHANVQEHIRFLHEPKETFQSARVTMLLGAGDCDDHARLLYSLARAGGLDAQLLFFEEDEQPIHVVTKLRDSIGWQWAETTLDARYGEEPFEALERLAPADGSNPMKAPGSSAGLGFLGLEFVSPSDVATRKAQLDATMKSLAADVAACTSLSASTLASWSGFVGAWQTFMATKPSIFNAGGQGRQAGDYTTQIRDWQSRVASACTLSAPVLPPPKDDPIVGTVTALAITAGVAAAAWTFAPALRALLEGRRRRGRA